MLPNRLPSPTLEASLFSKKFHSDMTRSPHALLTKRYSRVLFAGIVFLSALYFLLKAENTSSYTILDLSLEMPPYPQSNTSLASQELPPLYREWHEYERNLPQHDLTLPPPEGEAAKFIFMANHAHASGWGNVLQEMIFNAHLAYATKRAFVFDNYTWDRHESEYSEFNGKIIPSRVPVSTMLSGPIIGGTFGPNSDVPRAVSREYYRKVCPEPTVIRSEETKEQISSHDGLTVMNGWIEKVNSIEDRCLEIDQNSPHLFDIWMFGSDTVLSFWPTLRESPIITRYGFSPLIMSAYTANKDVFAPLPPPTFFSQLFKSLPSWLFEPEDDGDYATIMEAKPIPGLLTIHLRRGDFAEHCIHLEHWNSQFTGFNSFPEIVDKLQIEEGDDKKKVYQGHCYPEIEDIVKKINQVRRDTSTYLKSRRSSAKFGKAVGDGWAEELKRVYVMSNAPKEWLEELKQALKASAEAEGEKQWEAIHTSRDLELTWEQKYVAQTLDMYVAMRSQGFIGNGFSSLTSNIVMMRMAKNINAVHTRLW